MKTSFESTLNERDLTKIYLAQLGDEKSMIDLVNKYKAAIMTAASKYAEEYGMEDCVAEAQCAFIERVYNADYTDLRKFRSMLTKELADTVATNLNPYGLSRRRMTQVNNLPCIEPMGELSTLSFTEDDDSEISLKLQAVMADVLTDIEMDMVLNWMFSPNRTDDEAAADAGVSRRTYRRDLSVAFAKIREGL